MDAGATVEGSVPSGMLFSPHVEGSIGPGIGCLFICSGPGERSSEAAAKGKRDACPNNLSPGEPDACVARWFSFRRGAEGGIPRSQQVARERKSEGRL